MPELLLESDLDEFPGAPFSALVVQAACASLRRECGWHIAPQVTETLTLDGVEDCELILPTLRLVEITEIRDVTNPDSPVVLTDSRVSAATSILTRWRGWPCEPSSIEVDLVHGYSSCPPELYGEVAARCRATSSGVDTSTVVSTQIDDFKESYRESSSQSGSSLNSSLVAQFTISSGFA